LISRFFSGDKGETAADLIPGAALVWLMAAFALLLVPQWDRLPVWLIVSCIVLAVWRWLAQSGRLRLPGKWSRSGLMVVLVAVYIATVQGRFTVETASSFFVLAVGLKWLETRTVRDFYVLLFILVYLASVNFLFRHEIHWSVINLAGVVLLFVGLQVLNAPGIPGAVKSSWKRLGLMFLKTLPVVVLLFIFFPRMAPLWSVPLVSGEARTGISDSMTPGDISSLAQSDERAFRVTFGDDIPAHRDRYWRGLILDRLDGETWRQSRGEGFRRPGRVAVDGGVGELQPNQYDILLEPTDQTWAFALEGSVPVSDNVKESRDGLFRFDRPADTTVRYRMALQPGQDSNPGALENLENREQFLQLPGSGNPRARQLAQSLLEETSGPAQFANRILSRFREQQYFYTLRPPQMPENGIDSLLFDSKRGFCAHYAGAMTFLLRAADIPARVVVGYQGGSPGADNEYLIVRQYDAHAWVEAWIPGEGWTRFDPTAAISPERIESGLRDAMQEEGSFLENDWASPQRYGDMALVQWATLQLDKMNYQWQRWVVGYQGQSQMDLMSRLPGGFGLRELGYVTAGVVGGALLFAGLFTALRGRSFVRRDPLSRMLHRWHTLCEEAGVPVRHGETPLRQAERLAGAKPAVAESAMVFARLVNRHYYAGCPETSGSGRGKERVQGELAKMKRLLGTLRRQIRRSNSTTRQEK
jgi:transglutaminase-like putative cysteine protease